MQKIRKNMTKVLLIAGSTLVMGLAMSFAQLPQKNLKVVHAETSETLLSTITPTSSGNSQSPNEVATVNISGDIIYGYDDIINKGTWAAKSNGVGSITIVPKEGYSITKCVFVDQTDDTLEDDKSPFTITINRANGYPEASVEASDGVRSGSGGTITSIKVYGSQAESYNLYIGDDEVTEAKLSGEGWAYTPATANTHAILTLSGVTINSGYKVGNEINGIYYKGEDPLDIVLEENSFNKFTSGTAGFTGMEFNKADVTISGKGKLRIEATSYGIRYNNLVVNDATIEISSQLNGFNRNYPASTLTFNNANVDILSSNLYPISANTLNINNSTIVAYALKQAYNAVACYELNLSEGMQVMAGDDADTAVIVKDVATWNRRDHWVKFEPKPVGPQKQNGLSGGAIAGIVIGSVVGVSLIACLALFLLNKKGIINIPFLNKK